MRPLKLPVQLVIRGSGLAVGFAVRGPIVQEARYHGKLPVCEYKG